MCCANRNVSYQLKRYHACFLQEILTLRGIIIDCRITFYDYIIFCLHLIFYDLAMYVYFYIIKQILPSPFIGIYVSRTTWYYLTDIDIDNLLSVYLLLYLT